MVPVEWQLERKSEPLVKHPAMLMVYKPSKDTNLSRFEVVVHLKRNPAFYIWNIVVVLFLVTLSTGTTFLIDPAEFTNRMSLLLTMMLTTIGYKLVITGWLPVKPDLTFLDKYVLMNFMLHSSFTGLPSDGPKTRVRRYLFRCR